MLPTPKLLRATRGRVAPSTSTTAYQDISGLPSRDLLVLDCACTVHIPTQQCYLIASLIIAQISTVFLLFSSVHPSPNVNRKEDERKETHHAEPEATRRNFEIEIEGTDETTENKSQSITFFRPRIRIFASSHCHKR